MKQYENFSPEIYDGDETTEVISQKPSTVAERRLPSADELKPSAAKPRGRRAAPGKASARTKTTAAPKPKTQAAASRKGRRPDGMPLNEYVSSRWANMRSVRLLLGVFMGLFGGYLAISFLSYLVTCIVDQSAVLNDPVGYASVVANSGGEGGARISQFLINDTFGLGSVVIIVWLFGMALKELVGRPKFKSVNFTIKCFVALITVSLIVGLVTIGLDTPVNWGGLHGRFVNEFIIRFFGWPGAVFIGLFMVASFVVICLRDLVNWILRLKRKRDARKAEERAKREAEEAKAEARRRDALREKEEAGEAVEQKNPGDERDAHVRFMPDENAVAASGTTVASQVRTEAQPVVDELVEGDPDSYVLTDEEEINERRNAMEAAGVTAPSDDEYVLEDASDDAEKNKDDAEASPDIEADNAEGVKEEGVKVMEVNTNTIRESDSTNRVAATMGRRSFEFPPVEILRPGSKIINVDSAEQLSNQELIRKTLLDFKIPIDDIRATVGPTVTLYEVVPAAGVKVSRISSISDDIALRLAANGVRIIAPIPGRGTVGIEVPNRDPQVVSMRQIITSEKYQNSKYKLPVAIGVTIENDVYIADLAKMPHLLVAGATGQGKSVGLNAIIASLLYSKTPDELKFVMVDPKMVEFSMYARLDRQYLAKFDPDDEPIITDTDKVIFTLKSLCQEMDDRYMLLKGNSRNVEEYNEKVKSGKLSGDGHRFLPYIVVIIDEFSDLIMQAGKEIEMPIARLAQKARAVGMHVIIATQRPSTQVITGNIKANFPTRIAFKVSSMVDSRTIIDQSGAQHLIGRGDLLINNNSDLVRVQCAFIDTPEVEAIVDHVSSQPYRPGPYMLPEPAVGSADEQTSGGYAGKFQERDPLLIEAARSVVMSNQASTSALQRRFSLGYNRAGKIMDQLEALGVVGASNGSKARAVLMDSSSLEDLISTL